MFPSNVVTPKMGIRKAQFPLNFGGLKPREQTLVLQLLKTVRKTADVSRGWRVWYSSPFLFIYWWEFLQFPLIWNILFLYCFFIQLANGCYKRPRPPLPPPFFLRPVHTFRCSQYDSWDQSPKTFVVPAGDFCSSLLIPPAKPQCARNKNTDAPRLSIFDGEGTDCTIKMFNSPGMQFNRYHQKFPVASCIYFYWSIQYFYIKTLPLNCVPDDPANANCLNSITSGNNKSETWLVFITHGFTGSLNSDWLKPLRKSILLRYIKSINTILPIAMLKDMLIDWVLDIKQVTVVSLGLLLGGEPSLPRFHPKRRSGEHVCQDCFLKGTMPGWEIVCVSNGFVDLTLHGTLCLGHLLPPWWLVISWPVWLSRWNPT